MQLTIGYLPGEGVGPELLAVVLPVLQETCSGGLEFVDCSDGLDHNVAGLIKGPYRTTPGRHSRNSEIRRAFGLDANLRFVEFLEGRNASIVARPNVRLTEHRFASLLKLVEQLGPEVVVAHHGTLIARERRLPELAGEHRCMLTDTCFAKLHELRGKAVVASFLAGDYLASALASIGLGIGSVYGINLALRARLGDASFAVAEPAHGSVEGHVGRDTANPIGILLSGGLLLRHLGFVEQSCAIRHAVLATVKNEGLQPAEIAERYPASAPPLPTREFCAAVCRNLI